MESKLVSLALGFCQGRRCRSPKVGFMTLCFYKRPPSVPAFTNCKTAREDYCFYEEEQTEKQPSARALQRAPPEAARPCAVSAPLGGAPTPPPRAAAAAGTGRGPPSSLSSYSVPLLSGSNGFSALPRFSLKRVLPSATEAGHHLNRDTTGVTRRASAHRGGGTSVAKGASVRSEGPRTRGQLILPSSFIST